MTWAPLHRLAAGALGPAALLASCHSTPSDEREAAARKALDEAASASAATAPAGAPSAAATADGAAPAGDGVVVLQSGARLTMPAGAMKKPFDAARRLPDEVKKAHLFHLGSKDRLLMVNEMTLLNDSCEATLDREAKRMKTAQDDTDPQRLEYRRMGAFESFELDGHRVLYGESKNRGLGPGDGTKHPMVAMATMLMCRDKSYVAMMFVSQEPELPTDMKKTLSAIVQSYRK